jgi:hypothetical protein
VRDVEVAPAEALGNVEDALGEELAQLFAAGLRKKNGPCSVCTSAICHI